MSEVHELYRSLLGVPGAQPVAEALSEPLVRSNDFKIETTNDLAGSTEFPPVLSYPTGAIIAYHTPEGVRRQGLITAETQNRHTGRELTDIMIGAYKGHVDMLQTYANENLHSIGLAAFMMQSVVRARKAGLRTVASFNMYSAVDSSNHFTALQIPRAAYDHFSATITNDLAAFELAYAERIGERTGLVALAEEANFAGRLAFVFAAMHLPSGDEIATSLRARFTQ